MALTKETVIDEITVTLNGTVLYREKISILEDNVVVSSTYHRYSLPPGSNLDNVPAKVVTICNAAWTEEVIADFQASIPSANT